MFLETCKIQVFFLWLLKWLFFIRLVKPSQGNGNYTKEELSVLRKTSTINNREYLPFLDEIDNHEKFAFSSPFTYELFKSLDYHVFNNTWLTSEIEIDGFLAGMG